MIKRVLNSQGPVKCPVCGLDLDGRITYAHVAGELKPTWVHTKCIGGKRE